MTRTARTRKHQGFDLEKRLAPVERAVERDPKRWRGNWSAWEHAPLSSELLAQLEEGNTRAEGTCSRPIEKRWSEVRVDLGCGKGAFTVESAMREPNVLFVGLDAEPVCSMHAAEEACTHDASNVVFPIDEDPRMSELFAEGEVSTIYINYPTPFPKRKHAEKRLVHADRLIEYRRVLAPDGIVYFKTDSEPLFKFALNQFELAGYDIVWQTCDCRSERPDEPKTLYEEKLGAKGARALALVAKMRDGFVANEDGAEQPFPMSLYDYLPDDLESLTYVPHGMSNGIENMINFRRHERARAQKESRA